MPELREKLCGFAGRGKNKLSYLTLVKDQSFFNVYSALTISDGIITPASKYLNLSFRRKRETIEKTGYRIKSGMTYFDKFNCRSINQSSNYC